MRLTAGHLACLVTLLLAAGCSKTAKTGHLSGKVTFKGRPVPAGYITFTPDSSKGNLGPLKLVQIKDGVYDTAQEAEPGLSPGPTIIRIAGFDGKPIPLFHQGKQIFNPYEINDTVPEGVATKDFDVPAAAANDLKIVPTAEK